MSIRVFVVVLLLLGGAGLAAPWVAPYGEQERVRQDEPMSPSAKHWFGTDLQGRDLFTRVLYGARISFLVALAGAFVSIGIGVFYGMASGYLGGRWDDILMRVVDVLYGLPYLFFVIVLVAWIGRGTLNLFLALGCVQWLLMARVVRGQTLSLRERPFIEASRSLGAGVGRVLFRHLLPNLAGPIVVCASLTVPAGMLEEAFLSFLGVGVPPPAASWGTLLAEGWPLVEVYPWLLLFPAVFLAATVLCWNLLGDALADVFRMRGAS